MFQEFVFRAQYQQLMFELRCPSPSQGFTSGDAEGNPGKNFEVGDLIVSNNASWLAGWQEGAYVRDEVCVLSTVNEIRNICNILHPTGKIEGAPLSCSRNVNKVALKSAT